MFRGVKRNVYLEFIHVGRGGTPVRHPGLSFRATRKLEPFFAKLPRRIRGRYFHKNYDWKNDSRSHLPGWNFAVFRNTGIRTLFIWLTEYEQRPIAPKPVKVRHPNGVHSLVALELELNKAGQWFFGKLLGAQLERPLKFGGQKFYFTAGKKTRLVGVILAARSMSAFRHLKAGEWRGKPAVVIPNPAAMWNLVVVQG